MNGKDIFQGLQYIGEDLIEKGEYGELPTMAEKEVKRLTLRKPLMIAAIVAIMLLLVGCAVVYLLSMQEIKLGEEQATYDVYDYDPQTGEAVAFVGTKTETQQVLTLAGLSGTPASQAAQEWFVFRQSYDPDREIQKSMWGNEPEFPEAYYGYGLYSQDMKDKLDEILTKYDLKLRGKKIEFQTSKLLFQALGVESVLNPDSEAGMQSIYGNYYESGNLDVYFEITLPGEIGNEPEKTRGILYYRPKDCFIPDTAVLQEAQWEEWNYTTASGDKVLIIRSDDSGSAWIFSDTGRYTASLHLDIIRRIYEETENGTPVAKFDLMSKAQLEQVADAVNFSLEPKLVDGWETLSDGAVPAGQEINGYCIEPVSAFTDGYGYRIVLRVAAPQGVTLTDPDDHTVRIDPGDGVIGYCEEDGDGKRNTCYYILSDYTPSYEIPTDGSLPYPEGTVIPVYWEDLYYHSYDFETNESTDTLLTEGTWSFDVPLNDADTREIELLSQPISAKACIGWKMDGTDVTEELEITSLKLRSLGIYLTCENQSADFFAFTGQPSCVVMKNGTKVEFYSGNFRQPLDLDQVAYVQLADKTIIPMPGVDEETVKMISEAMPTEPPEPEIPVFEDGIELVTEPVTLKNLAGYVTDATGDMEPLYEYFALTSFVLHPEGAVALDSRALERPETEIQVVMQDGSQILLTNSGCGRNNGVAFSTFTAETSIDLSKADYVLLPDGTKLTIPNSAQ